MPKARVVVDASALVAACSGGICLDALTVALSSCAVFVSDEVENELKLLTRTLHRRHWSNRIKGTFDEVVRLFLSQATKKETGLSVQLSRDPSDNIYLSLCKSVKADF